jgi:transposase-like protein
LRARCHTVVADDDAAVGQQLLHHAKAEGKAEIQPHRVTDAAGGRQMALDEVVLKISGVKHWLWQAVDQSGTVLDVLVRRRRDKGAAKRLLRKLLKKHAPRHDRSPTS